MPRNLVICFDGTSNEFGPENTNVVRVIQVLDRDPAKQRLFYDPGVGTLPEPSLFTKTAKWASKVIGLGFGAGLVRNVEEAYSYLMDAWEPGDRVFLFGFSRGAYTARVLAGMLHSLGLPPRGNHNLVPYVTRLFKAVRKESGAGVAKHWKLCDEFRWTFSRPTFEGDDDRRFPVHFLGVWDTVSSVGWVWDPARFPFTARNPGIGVIRHAVSVDERRWFFRQNLMKPAREGQDLVEMWFPGVHSDVGGGYREEDGGLWRGAFSWVLDAAREAGLRVDEARLRAVLHRTPPPEHPWADRQHESLDWKWWPMEFFPKLKKEPGAAYSRPRWGRGRRRFVPKGALLHEFTLRRIRDTAYSPPNLPEAFRRKVRALREVPPALPLDR